MARPAQPRPPEVGDTEFGKGGQPAPFFIGTLLTALNETPCSATRRRCVARQMIFSTLILLIFPVLMVFAAASDLLTMRISNKLVLMLIVGFFIVALVAQLPPDVIIMNLGCAAVVLVAAFAFFAFGWIGGGDAKFAAATVLWIGLGPLLPYIVYSGLLGGALTLLLLAVRNLPLPAPMQRIAWIDRLHDKKQGVPYGLALAAGGLLVYPQTMIFKSFLA